MAEVHGNRIHLQGPFTRINLKSINSTLHLFGTTGKAELESLSLRRSCSMVVQGSPDGRFKVLLGDTLHKLHSHHSRRFQNQTDPLILAETSFYQCFRQVEPGYRSFASSLRSYPEIRDSMAGFVLHIRTYPHVGILVRCPYTGFVPLTGYDERDRRSLADCVR